MQPKGKMSLQGKLPSQNTDAPLLLVYYPLLPPNDIFVGSLP